MEKPHRTTALILIDHGSKLTEANDLLEQIASRIRERGIYLAVEAAHMEIAPPTLGEAFRSCVEAGAESVVVVPYFLAPGNHVSNDIPRMAAEAAAPHPKVKWSLARPLDLDDRIVEVVMDRAAAAESGLPR